MCCASRPSRAQAIEPFGLIAGHLDHFDGHARQRLLQGRRPGGAVTLRVVGFQQQEVGLGLDGHQARLAAVEVLVQAGGDLLGQHAGGQVLLLLVGVSEQGILEADSQSLLGTEGGGDEAVQLSQFQEASQGSQPGIAGKVEDQVQGGDESAEKAVASGAVQEGDQCRFEVGVGRAVVAEPVAQGRARHAVVASELALGVGWVVGIVEVVACLDGFGACPAEGVWP